MNNNKLREVARRFRSKGIIVNGLIFSCILYFASVIFSHKYDWDIDQFMYFGSRLANGELAFVREYDDKSIAVHALFIIPFWLKSIRIWYIISTAAASVTAYNLYKTLAKYESTGKSQAIISAIYFAFLMTSTRGGINHINGIAACMMLAAINKIALSSKKDTPIAVKNKIPVYIFLAAWSVSIRPYYILTILAAISWPAIRTLLANYNSKNKSKSDNFFRSNILLNSLKMAALLITFMVSINILPYILTGESKALTDAFIINKISITPNLQQGVISILIIALQKAPLIMAPLIASNIFLILDAFRLAKERDFYMLNFLERNLDLIYSGSLMPMLLAFMMSTRHFHNHYLALFAPFSAIALYLLLIQRNYSKTTGFIYKKSKPYGKLSKISCITIGLGLTYHCIYPIIKINEQFSSWGKVRTQGRENILGELEALVRKDGKNNSFVVTRDNHFHWRLNQSRMGIPHASLLSKIATDHENISQATNKASELQTQFKYPKTSELCETMLHANPDIYLVPKNTAEEKCLAKENSNYSYYKKVERGHAWKLARTKTGIIFIKK